MEVLPTVVASAPVALPAHNGTPGAGAEFHGEWGWANDWIEVRGEGEVRWPVRTDGGSYTAEVLYGGGGEVELAGETFALPEADAPPSFPPPGHRRIVTTGEAITRDWASAEVGPFELKAGEREIVVVVRGEVDVKAVRLVPVE